MDQDLDQDLALLSKGDLIQEIVKLRKAIRAHRDASGHDLCWHQPALWRLLPEAAATDASCAARIQVPSWPAFMRGCVRYRQSLDEQLPASPRTDEVFGGAPDEDRKG